LGILLAVVLVFQPLFLLGSLSFRRFAFLKTAGFLLALPLVYGLLTGSLFSLSMEASLETFYGRGTWNFTEISWGPGIIFLIIIPVWLLVAGYLKLTESEVKGGISR